MRMAIASRAHFILGASVAILCLDQAIAISTSRYSRRPQLRRASSCNYAPRARNVKAWGNRPRPEQARLESTEGARYAVAIAIIVKCQRTFRRQEYSAPSALLPLLAFPWGDAPGFRMSRLWR